MTTCKCCGQVLPAGGDSGAPRDRARLVEARHEARQTDADTRGDGHSERHTSIGVDEALLAMCNRAHADTERRGAASVEIADLVIVLTAARLTDADYEADGLSRRELSIAAERALALAVRRQGGAKIRTSAELRVLLARAESVAKSEAREFASPIDFLRALAHRSSDLVSARFVPDAKLTVRGRAEAVRRAEGPAGGGSWRDLRQSRFDFEARQAGRGYERAGADPAPARTATVSHREQVLMERLERQEQALSNLLDQVSRLREARNASAHDDHDEAPIRERRWRRRTFTIGERRGSGAAADRRHVGARSAEAGVLRLVAGGEGVRPSRRSKRQRDIMPEIDEPLPSGDLEADDDADGQGDRMKRFYLAPDDDIVKAPSIGPKTAARLTPAGLVLVRDLLSCDPEDVARRTANRYISANRVAEWKAQARLVCTIPWLRGTHAQLLVGAGYDTLAKLSRADASSVCSAILRFVATREGQSILRSSPPPEIDRIACWIENTALAEPARAA